MTGVRVGAHEGFDRVVFDLAGPGAAGWLVRYVDGAALGGIGSPVNLAGSHILAVHLRGMGVPPPGSTAYDPSILVVGGSALTTVTEVMRASMFEGQVDAFIGTRAQRPYRVLLLENPARLVVDVAHG